MNPILSRLEKNPVIAAVRTPEAAADACAAPVEAAFLLCGDILSVGGLVRRLREAGKLVLVHMDLLGGIGRDPQAVEYLARAVGPDGIISTRSQLIRAARDRERGEVLPALGRHIRFLKAPGGNLPGAAAAALQALDN